MHGPKMAWKSLLMMFLLRMSPLGQDDRIMYIEAPQKIDG